MAASDRKGDDPRLLARFRYGAVAATLVVLVLYVIGAEFQLPFLRSDFELDPTVLFGLMGFLSVLLGVEFLSRIPAIKQGPGDDH